MGPPLVDAELLMIHSYRANEKKRVPHMLIYTSKNHAGLDCGDKARHWIVPPCMCH